MQMQQDYILPTSQQWMYSMNDNDIKDEKQWMI